MIRPVIGTVVARVAATGMSLILVALAGRNLGVEGLGTISLLVLGVTLILVLAHVVGGGGLVYVAPRLGVRNVLLPAYGWALLTATIALSVLLVLPIVPEEWILHAVGLAFLQALNSIHFNILVARERIQAQNVLVVGQATMQVALFAALLHSGPPEMMDYVLATYVAHGATAILSGALALQHRKEGTRRGTSESFRALLEQGGVAQLTNLAQLLNYRAAYYLIERFKGTAALGLYSVAMQLAEGSWLVPKSIGGVLYSKVSNLEERRQQLRITAILFKVAVLVGAVCCGVLVILPGALYAWIFGPEVHGLTPILIAVAPGLIAMSGSQVLSHYFSGTGLVRHNLVASSLGLFLTVAAGWPLIARYGLTGAALTATLAYCTAVAYQLVTFMRLSGLPLRLLLPQRDDLRKARAAWRLHRNKRADQGSYI